MHRDTFWAADPRLTIVELSTVNGPCTIVTKVGVARVGANVMVQTMAGPEVQPSTMPVPEIGVPATAGSTVGT